VSDSPSAIEPSTLLLVDDDELDRMSVRRALRAGGVGAQILEAPDATRGLELLRSTKVDCAFLDFNMPGRDGLWLVKEARAQGIRTPLIVLTGQGDERTAVELMKAGASDYLAKASITPERVASGLRQALRVFEVEDALRQSEQRVRLAVEATKLGTWDFDPASGRIDLSDRCKQLFGMRPEMAGTYESFLARLHPDDRERTDSAVRRALDPASGGEYDIEYRTIGIDPTVERWLRATGRAFFDEAGRALRLIGTAQDIGERKQLEVQRTRLFEAERLAREGAEAASRMREDLIAIVSHDLRNPLSVITMSAALLPAAIVPDATGRAVKLVETITRSADRMKRLISDLLDVASIDGGGLVVQVEPHDASGLLHDAVEMLLPVAADKSILLDARDVPSGLQVMADKERVLQVLSNLVGNAIKFTSEGGSISVGAQVDGASIRFSVADTGRGISEEQMPHLFDRYWQAKKDGRLGIGLGLSIAKGIVEAHGGKIWAESVLGKGTTFRFTLRRTDLEAG
jgi:PAS domain S-box-containing protein